MRAGRCVSGARAGLSFAVAGLLAMTGASARLAWAQPAAQTIAQRHAEALAYLAAHVDSEDMTMIPMRDGVRLYSLVLFPRGQPRQNLPAVLLRNPYLTKGMGSGFAEYVASLLQHGYAVVFHNERGRYFSEGTYTYLVGSGNDGYDTVQWLGGEAGGQGEV